MVNPQIANPQKNRKSANFSLQDSEDETLISEVWSFAKTSYTIRPKPHVYEYLCFMLRLLYTLKVRNADFWKLQVRKIKLGSASRKSPIATFAEDPQILLIW